MSMDFKIESDSDKAFHLYRNVKYVRHSIYRGMYVCRHSIYTGMWCKQNRPPTGTHAFEKSSMNSPLVAQQANIQNTPTVITDETYKDSLLQRTCEWVCVNTWHDQSSLVKWVCINQPIHPVGDSLKLLTLLNAVCHDTCLQVVNR